MTNDRSYCDSDTIPAYQIRASFDDTTIRVYQAFSDEIADSALAHGTFVSPPFSMNRMTWIKPSFLWMMYRSGWALKDDRQRRILAIDITREDFQWALDHACLSHCPEHQTHEQWRARKDVSPVVVQWDPERDTSFRPLSHRTIQIGLGAPAVVHYVSQWIRNISDVTPLARAVHQKVQADDHEAIARMLPKETPYPASIEAILPVRPINGYDFRTGSPMPSASR